MSSTLPWHFKIEGFINPDLYLPDLKVYPDCFASDDCLILYKVEKQGRSFVSVTNGFLCKVNIYDPSAIWYSEVGEVDVIGWLPMPICNFKLPRFTKRSKIHIHLEIQNKEKNVFNKAQFTSINKSLPNLPQPDPIQEGEPLVVIKQLSSTSGIDFFFSIARWNSKAGSLTTDCKEGHVIGWMKMPNLRTLPFQVIDWLI